jgi:putative nucleotidyltransferase with HDIG domain
MVARQISMDAVLAKLEEIPTLPSIVYELSQVINDPMASTSDVERIMANDLSLTTKVLQLVNSAYYAIPGGVSTLSRAVSYIGFETVNQLVLSASILQALEIKGPQRFNTSEFWKHSIGVAISAESIARFVHHPSPADLFTCGLVHDLGKVALYAIEPEAMLAAVAKSRESQVTYEEAEAQLKLPSHTHIGQALAQRWNLPARIQACILHHHTKEHSQRGGVTAEISRDVEVVFLANLLIHALKFGDSGHTQIVNAPRENLERLALDPLKDLRPLLLQIKSDLDKAADFLRVLGGGTGGSGGTGGATKV